MPTDIYRNIVGGDTSLTLDDAWQAARLAGLAADIAELPMGMQTYISEGGGGLSGGQKQRLLIARAMVRQAAHPLLRRGHERARQPDPELSE